MAFYVVNKTGTTIQVTVNERKGAAGAVNEYDLIITRRPLGLRRPVASLMLTDANLRPVPVIAPFTITVDDRLRVRWRSGTDKDNDLIFLIEEFLS